MEYENYICMRKMIMEFLETRTIACVRKRHFPLIMQIWKPMKSVISTAKYLTISVQYGTWFWKIGLSGHGYWNTLSASAMPHFSSKWRHVNCSVQKPFAVLPETFFRVLGVYFCTGSLYRHCSMLWRNTDAICLRFWPSKHTTRGRHSTNSISMLL